MADNSTESLELHSDEMTVRKYLTRQHASSINCVH